MATSCPCPNQIKTQRSTQQRSTSSIRRVRNKLCTKIVAKIKSWSLDAILCCYCYSGHHQMRRSQWIFGGLSHRLVYFPTLPLTSCDPAKIKSWSLDAILCCYCYADHYQMRRSKRIFGCPTHRLIYFPTLPLTCYPCAVGWCDNMRSLASMPRVGSSDASKRACRNNLNIMSSHNFQPRSRTLQSISISAFEHYEVLFHICLVSKKYSNSSFH